MSTQSVEMFKSWARVFVAAILTAYLTHLSAGGDPVSAPWRAFAIAGIVAVGPMVLRWLNPNDPVYGRGAKAPIEDAASD